MDSNGVLVVKYNYTAYGTITSITGSLSSTIGAYNPFRYKGYYYDSETKMYYCKSRYYVPEWCRWLNADHVAYLDLDEINGLNLYAYCNNNPIMLVDDEGDCAISIGVAIAIGLASLFAGVAATAVIKPEVYYEAEQGLQVIGDNFKQTITNTFVTASMPFMLSFVALDNVLLSGQTGNQRDSGLAEEFPDNAKGNKDLDDAKKKARKEGNMKYARRLEKEQKARNNRNKRKKRGGPKMRGVLYFLLLHELIRRY